MCGSTSAASASSDRRGWIHLHLPRQGARHLRTFWPSQPNEGSYLSQYVGTQATMSRWEDHSTDQVQYDGNIKSEIKSFVGPAAWGGCSTSASLASKTITEPLRRSCVPDQRAKYFESAC